MKEKSQRYGTFFVLLRTFFLGGLLADGITAMVIEECCLLSIASGYIASAPAELLVAEDACTSRG